MSKRKKSFSQNDTELKKRKLHNGDVDEDDSIEEEEDSNDDEEIEFNRESETRSGYIISVSLENFMCHKNLKVSFGPNINFLTGPNGSGKSAILVAIAIGLGSKTSFTNRGKKLESLISHEAQYARIVIIISNQGSDPFKKEIYGNKIIVERMLKRGGGGGYKMKDSKGKVVTSSRLDLSLMVEHFNILNDNPCSILMQDTSRQYLAESTPQTKYKFFLIATQLEKIKEDYEIVGSSGEKMQKLLARKKKSIPLIEKSVEDLEEEYRGLEELRDLEGQIDHLQQLLCWILLKEKQKEIDKLEESKLKIDNEIEKTNAKLQKIIDYEKERKQNVDTHNAELDETAEILNRYKDEKKKIETLTNDALKEERLCSSRKSDLMKQIQISSTRKQKVLDTIEEIKSASSSREMDSKMKEIQMKKQELDRIREEINEGKSMFEEKQQIFEQENQQKIDYTRHVQQKQSMVDSLKTKLKEIDRQKQNQLLVFGKNTPQLLNLIEKNKHRFRRVPIGPIGKEITLKDNSWAAAIETALGSILFTFIVDNHEQDEKLLKELCRQLDCQVPMIVQRHSNQPYVIPNEQLPHSDLLTIYDAIVSSNTVVMNALIDHKSIHNLVLCNDRHEGEAIIQSHSSQGHNRVKTIFLKNGSRLFSRNGSMSFVAGRADARVISVDFDELHRSTSDQLRLRSNELQQMIVELKNIDQRVILCEKEMKSYQAQIQPLSHKEIKLKKEITTLEEELQQKDDTPDIAELQQNAAELEKKLSSYNDDISKVDQEMKDLKLKFNSLKTTLQECVDNIKSAEATLNEKSETIRKIQEKAYKLEQIKTSYKDKEMKFKKALDDIENEKIENEKNKKEIEKMLEDIPPPKNDELKHSSADLKKEIERRKALLKTQLQEKDRKSIDDVYKQLLTARKNLKSTQKLFNLLESLQQQVELQLDRRLEDWKKQLKKHASQIRRLFSVFLSNKGHAGHIKFDHNDRTLYVTVQLENLRTSSQPHTQTVNSLSGGERSYATVSLLMALWASMETPFTAMDEFDVFMDQINRMKSTEMLLQFARIRKDQQFIFITPQSLQHVEPASDLTIISMNPPKR